MDFRQNTMVKWNDGVTKGIGKVVGLATTGEAVIGKGLIVEVLESMPVLPNEIYPYTHRVVFEVHVEKLLDE